MHSPVAIPECPQPANLNRNTPVEDALSLYSSEHSSPTPMVGAYPSPYRASTAAAFADINRALDTRSLRNSVYANFQGSQVPPKVKSSPRSSLKPLSLSIRRANTSAPADQPDRPAHLASMRSHSLPNRPKKAAHSETKYEPLIDGDGTSTVQTSDTDCAVPGEGLMVIEGRAMLPLSELEENEIPRRKDAHKFTGSATTNTVDISPNGKRSSKRKRATTCLIM